MRYPKITTTEGESRRASLITVISNFGCCHSLMVKLFLHAHTRVALNVHSYVEEGGGLLLIINADTHMAAQFDPINTSFKKWACTLKFGEEVKLCCFSQTIYAQ